MLTGSMETIQTYEAQLDITVTNPCELTGQILANTITDIEYWIGSGPVSHVLGTGYWDDLWSTSTPNYCGLKNCELVESDQSTVSTASSFTLTNT